jgi:archaellum component FlaC
MELYIGPGRNKKTVKTLLDSHKKEIKDFTTSVEKEFGDGKFCPYTSGYITKPDFKDVRDRYTIISDLYSAAYNICQSEPKVAGELFELCTKLYRERVDLVECALSEYITKYMNEHEPLTRFSCDDMKLYISRNIEVDYKHNVLSASIIDTVWDHVYAERERAKLNTQLEQINKRFDELDNKIDVLNATINRHDKRLNCIDTGNIDQLTTNVDYINKKYDMNKNKVIMIAQSVKQLRSQRTDIDALTSNYNEMFNDVKKHLNTLDERLCWCDAKLSTSEECNINIGAQFKLINEKLDTLNSQPHMVTTTNDTSQLDHVKEQLNALTDKISMIEQRLATHGELSIKQHDEDHTDSNNFNEQHSVKLTEFDKRLDTHINRFARISKQLIDISYGLTQHTERFTKVDERIKLIEKQHNQTQNYLFQLTRELQ